MTTGQTTRRLRRLIATTALLALCAATVEGAWIQWVGPGANNHWYLLVHDQQKDWFQARAAAQVLGGDLVTITSLDEQMFIANTLFGGVADLSSKTVNNASLIGSWWIGATDRAGALTGAAEGTFKWVTGEAWSFTNWGAGQPDNNSSSPFGDGTEGEDFVQLVWRNGWTSTYPGGWNDARQAGYSGIANLPHLDLKGFIVERITDPNPRPIPEPGSSLTLLALGVVVLRAFRRHA